MSRSGCYSLDILVGWVFLILHLNITSSNLDPNASADIPVLFEYGIQSSTPSQYFKETSTGISKLPVIVHQVETA